MEPYGPPDHFDEPWQAQAFALAVALAETGLFSWREWTQALSAAIGDIEARGEAIDGARYPAAWLAALEALTVERGGLAREAIDRRADAWGEAYAHTPHGRPVALGSETGG